MFDRCPIMLTEDERDWRPRPFRFFNAWLSSPKCLKVIEEAWMIDVNQRWATYRLINKLKNMKEVLKEWVKVEFVDLQGKLVKLESALNDLDLKVE